MNARIFVVVATALAVSGCGGPDSAASRIATDFYEAVSDGDSRTACSLLAPQTRNELEQSTGQSCAEALPSELAEVADGSITTAAYGDGAIATRGGDTVFLVRFANGWRVTAAGCTRVADDKPYDCTVKGA